MNTTTFVGLPIKGWFQHGICRGLKGIAYQKTDSKSYQEMHYSECLGVWVESGPKEHWFKTEDNTVWIFDSNIIQNQC